MVDAAQPAFEIGEYEVDDRQEGFGDVHVAPLRDGGMIIAALAQLHVTAPVVGNDDGSWRNTALDEFAQRLGATIWRNGKTDASCVAPGPTLVAAPLLLALADFGPQPRAPCR